MVFDSIVRWPVGWLVRSFLNSRPSANGCIDCQVAGGWVGSGWTRAITYVRAGSQHIAVALHSPGGVLHPRPT